MSELVNDYPEQASAVSRTISGPVRTATQLVPAAIAVELVDAFWINFDDRQYAAALAAGLLITSWVQNFIESRKGKAFLK